MSLGSSQIDVGGTTATTGGTGTDLLSKGSPSNSEHKMLLDDGADYVAAETIDFLANAPSVLSSAPNGYTQARNMVRIKKPLLLDNGLYTTLTAKCEISVDVEASAAEKLLMREHMAQVLMAVDYQNFWDKQSLS